MKAAWSTIKLQLKLSYSQPNVNLNWFEVSMKVIINKTLWHTFQQEFGLTKYGVLNVFK